MPGDESLMARLPQVGGDHNNWGDILNEYLRQAHDEDGVIKPNSISAAQLRPGSVTTPTIADGAVTQSKLAPSVVAQLGGQGDAGASAYEIALQHGFVGTEVAWLASLQGSAGATGPAGAGVPTGGTLGQILAKASNANHDTVWVNAPSGSGGGDATDLSTTTTATTVTVVSSTGNDATLATATTSNAGVLSAADKTKLDGIATAATANASDAQLRDRSTHTGSQAISTVTGLQSALDNKADTEDISDLSNQVDDLETSKQDINYRYWNGTGGVGTWDARPSLPAGRHAEAFSVVDGLAPPPPDALEGDLWFRHPDAV